MPIGTAVHERTFALAGSLNYREWSGYYAVSAYEAHHEHEYNAIRNASALIDVSPLFKYLVRGRDAVKLVDRVITRDAFKLAIGQVYYTPWCDEHGKVIDDGTVTRLAEDTSAGPLRIRACDGSRRTRSDSTSPSRTSPSRWPRWPCRARHRASCSTPSRMPISRA